jgi:hypothetical protein
MTLQTTAFLSRGLNQASLAELLSSDTSWK